VAEETAKPMSDTGVRLDQAEQRLLAGMPLHAITSVHGEAGLRDRQLQRDPGGAGNRRPRPGPGHLWVVT
jgi:hypothetical protein